MARKGMLRYFIEALISFSALVPLLANATSNETLWSRNKYVVNDDTHDELIFINKQQGLTGRSAGLQSTSDSNYQLWFVNKTSGSYTLSVIVFNGADYDQPNMSARIIWTANDGHHVGENANFSFTSDGNLELKDEGGKLAWSSQTAHKGAQYLSMSDTGNLILKNDSNGIVWQSYEENDTSNHKAKWGAIAMEL